jgi:(2R)-ethylmalonyl-CoA mutase
VLGLSVLSGAHLDIATLVLEELGRHGVRDAIPVVLGGIVPDEDVPALERLGVRAVFTPKDYDLMAVMDRVLDVIGAPVPEASTHAASA